MFRTCELVVVNKVDLLPHLSYDIEKLRHNLESVNPGTEVIECSARTGEGTEAFAEWLSGVAAREAATV
jgi:hydrogenase nickel incorporation protein HypB